jgi:hypothetical protein
MVKLLSENVASGGKIFSHIFNALLYVQRSCNVTKFLTVTVHPDGELQHFSESHFS